MSDENKISEMESFGYKVLRPIPSICIDAILNNGTVNGKTLKLAFIDTETTGLDLAIDEVIELGVVLGEFDCTNGNLIKVLDSYQGFREPVNASISEEAFMVHGISASDVKGKSIDMVRVREILNKADIACSFNASFDRPMLEKVFPDLEKIPFFCSMLEVDWGFSTKKLDYLVTKLGYHFNSHRALDDAWASLFILGLNSVVTGKPYVIQLIENINEIYTDVLALDAPFSRKDFLKSRGYKFFDEKGVKYWHKMMKQSDVVDELGTLKRVVYAGMSPSTQLRLNHVNRYDRFSGRVSSFEFVKVLM